MRLDHEMLILGQIMCVSVCLPAVFPSWCSYMKIGYFLFCSVLYFFTSRVGNPISIFNFRTLVFLPSATHTLFTWSETSMLMFSIFLSSSHAFSVSLDSLLRLIFFSSIFYLSLSVCMCLSFLSDSRTFVSS